MLSCRRNHICLNKWSAKEESIMKIIIYGLGSIQDQVSEYLRQEHEIV